MKFGQKPIYEANCKPVLEWVIVKKNILVMNFSLFF